MTPSPLGGLLAIHWMGGKIMWLSRREQKKSPHLIEADLGQLPAHIAIIMDGNGRWAQQRKLPRSMGHRAGVESMREVVKTCSRLGIKVLTVYAFSTENWRRPKAEVGVLMTLLIEYLRREIDELHRNQVVVRTLGNIAELPEEAVRELKAAYERTKHNQGLILNLALNYGGRAELVEAVRSLSEEVASGRLRPEDINEATISRALYTEGLPDPDLLIRTSGEMRLSNFLLWQLAYTEIVVVDQLWPDFTSQALIDAIQVYLSRERRFGGVKNAEE